MKMKMGLVLFLVFSLLLVTAVSAIRRSITRPSTNISPVQTDITDHIGSSSISPMRLDVAQILKRDQARVEYLNKRIKARRSKDHINTSTGSIPSVKQDQTDLMLGQHQGSMSTQPN